MCKKEFLYLKNLKSIMKNIFTLTFLFLMFNLSAQVYEVEVETKHKTDYSEKGLEWFSHIPDAENRKWNIEQNSNPRAIDYKFFASKTEQTATEEIRLNNEQGSAGEIKKSVPGLSFGSSYFDFEKGFNYRIDDVYGRKYIVKTALEKLEWKYFDESKEILGYKSYRATAKYNDYDVEIWFTKDIPFHFMPSTIFPIDGFVLEMNYYIENEYGKMNNYIKVKSIKLLDKAYKFKKIDENSKKSSIPVVTDDEIYKIWDEANDKRNELYNKEGVDKK